MESRLEIQPSELDETWEGLLINVSIMLELAELRRRDLPRSISKASVSLGKTTNHRLQITQLRVGPVVPGTRT